jgi:two-component system response regulator HydG
MSKARRILIVDDDRDLAESLADVLEARGFAVELAHSGEEGIEKFARAPFDLVLSDVKLPGMNGVESFFEFRRLCPNVNVVMMTGYSVEQLLQQAIDNGAVGVLHKPFAISDVIDLLERVKPQGMVLVADDDPDFAESLRPSLQRAGYAVAVATTGAAALESVTAGGVDCLVLDLRLPVLSGLEVYLELKRRGCAVPTIVITGYGNEEEESIGALRPLAHAVLTKPFDPTRLVDAIAAAAPRP